MTGNASAHHPVAPIFLVLLVVLAGPVVALSTGARFLSGRYSR